MNEEVKIPTKDELLGEQVPAEQTPQEAAPQQTPQFTEVEERAMRLGWTPKDDWKGDPLAWRPADVWLDRGEMLHELSRMKSKLETTEKQVAEAFKQGRTMAEAKFKEELAALKAARREAMQEGDFEKVDRIEDRMEIVKEKQREQVKAPVANEPPPEFSVFLQRNPWYNNEEKLRYMADAVGHAFLKKNPNALPAELYFHVEQEMLPFVKQPTRKGPPAPEGGRQNGGRSPSASGEGSLSGIEAQMSDEDRAIMNTLIKTKVFENKEEYLKEYRKVASK